MRETIFWLVALAFLSVGWWMNIIIVFGMGKGVQSVEGIARVIGFIIAPLGGFMGYM